MKVLGMVVCLLVAALAAPVFAAEWTPEQKQVIAVMDQYQKAWDNGDIRTLGQLMPDKIDMTSVALKQYSPAGDGVFTDKASFLSAYTNQQARQRSGPQVWGINQKITYLKVSVSGDEATVDRKIDWWTTGTRQVNSGTLAKKGQLKKLNGEWKFYADKMLPD